MNRYYPPFFHFNPPRYSYNTRPNNPCIEVSNTDCKGKNTESVFFEILGIKLYQDDVLILLLIYFLYSQNTDDLLLYILLFSLILT